MYPASMKFVVSSNLADPDAAARRLVKIANTTEAVHRTDHWPLHQGGRYAGPVPRRPGNRCRLRLAGAAKVQDTPAGAELFA
jgi:hypothetical protein